MFQSDIRAPRSGLRPSVLAAIVIVGLWWHWAMFSIFTTDVVNDYTPWFNHIVETGPIAAFARPFGAYTPPYLYLLALATPLKGLIADYYIVKLVAMAGNIALATACWRFLRERDVAGAGGYALALLALPSLMMNAALLGQTDGLYVAPIIMALSAALRRRHRAMLAWSGLALAIKLQAVLIGPFILALLIARRVPLRDWLITPAVYLLMLTPAWLAGWPASDLLNIYFRQADSTPDIARNAPNIWMVATVAGFDSQALTGLAATAAIGAIAAYVARFSATLRHFSNPMLLRMALLAPLIGAGLLPRMHERYFLLADIVSVLLALLSTDRDRWRIAVHIQTGSVLAVLGYLTGAEWMAALGAVPMIWATWLVLKPLVKRADNDNPLLARAA